LKPGQVEGGKTVAPILIVLSKNAFQLGRLQGRVTGTPSQFFRREEFDLFARRQFAVRINDSENVSFSYNCYAHGVTLFRILTNKQTQIGERVGTTMGATSQSVTPMESGKAEIRKAESRKKSRNWESRKQKSAKEKAEIRKAKSRNWESRKQKSNRQSGNPL